MERDEGVHSFGDAVERYLREVLPRKRGAKWERGRLLEIASHFEGRRLAELDAPDIAAWRDKRLAVVSEWSVLRESNILRSVLRTARDEWRWMHQDPFRGVRLPKNPRPRHQRWGWREIRRVLRFLGYRRQGAPRTKYQEVGLAFMIALATAMRAGEVLRVGPETLQGRVVKLGRTKTEPRAEVPLTARGARLCARVKGWTIDTRLLDALFRKARDGCLVRELRFHDARASALTWMARRVDILTLSRISRHKDLKILSNVYYRESAEEIAKRLR